MLIFFIHGVATRQTEYARELEKALKAEIVDRDLPSPICYPAFWGDLLGGTRRLWSILEGDLQHAKREDSNRSEDDNFLRYKDFREGLFSEFVGDFFAYFNAARGRKIRQKLARQLEDFLSSNPNEMELHIIAHSLGTVILWDALFSRRLNNEPDTQKLRMMLKLEKPRFGMRSIRLASITTMGSPIVFANQMLDVRAEELKCLTQAYDGTEPLRWTNVIHPADILAYPICNSIADLCRDRLVLDACLDIRDSYVVEKVGPIEKTAQIFGQSKIEMVWQTGGAHTSYFKVYDRETDTIREIVRTLLNESLCDRAISQLQQCPGITRDDNPENIKAAETRIIFKDGSGSICFFNKFGLIPHVYVFNDGQNMIFGAYVGSTDSGSLEKALIEISQFK